MSSGHDHVDFEPDQLGCESGKSFGFPLRVSALDDEVLPLDVAKLLQSFEESAPDPRGPRFGQRTVPRRPIRNTFTAGCASAAGSPDTSRSTAATSLVRVSPITIRLSSLVCPTHGSTAAAREASGGRLEPEVRRRVHQRRDRQLGDRGIVVPSAMVWTLTRSVELRHFSLKVALRKPLTALSASSVAWALYTTVGPFSTQGSL
jgi:hypothetical protein